MRRVSIFCYCILVWLFVVVCSADAGQWRDAFEEKNLHGWTLPFKNVPKNRDSKWKPGGGVLDVTLKRVKGLQIVDFLQWTGEKINAQNLTVTVHSIDAFPVSVWPPGDFGVFLGKQLPKNQADFAAGYFFSKSRVHPIQFSKDGKRKEGPIMASFLSRLQLKILFRSGHFRLFSEDVLLTEFKDLKLTRINVVGLLAMSNGVADEFHGKVDTFIISGPGIPHHNFVVQPKGKLATTWGKMKRRH